MTGAVSEADVAGAVHAHHVLKRVEVEVGRGDLGTLSTWAGERACVLVGRERPVAVALAELELAAGAEGEQVELAVVIQVGQRVVARVSV